MQFTLVSLITCHFLSHYRVKNTEALLFHFQSFITTLTTEQKDNPLLELLSNGRGSLDYAKNMVSGNQGPEMPPPSEAPQWCTCSVCRLMQTPDEDKCCGKQQCVTSYELFRNICLDREVLSVAIRTRFDITVEKPNYESNSFKLHTGSTFWEQKCKCVVLVVRSYLAAHGHCMDFYQLRGKQHFKVSG